jgi:peptidoglycan/LPS O-acetylase OafA/YrhL
VAQLTGRSEPVATTTAGEGAGGVAGFGRPGGRLGYRSGLEGLRGIAVLLVLAVHLGEFVVPSAADWLVPGGFLGVDLFFVLSGFLIGTILLTQLDQRGNILLGRFLGRRFVRLAPALALVLGAHYVYAATIHASLANERSIDIWAGLFAINWLPSVGRAVLNDMIHLWSVAIEGQFYLVIPFVLYPLHRCVRRTWAIVAMLSALVVVVAVVRYVEYRSWHDWILVYERFDTRSDTFLCGVIVAVLWNRGVLHATAARVAGALGAVTIGVLAFTTHTNPPRPASPFLFEGGFTLVAVAGAAVIAAAMLPGSAMETALAVRPLRALGRISYSLYLWHLPVFLWAHEHIRSTGPAIVTALGVSLVLATAAFYLAERPVLRNRFRAPSPAPRDVGAAAAQLDVPRQR